MGRIGARLLGHTRRLLFGIGAALCVAALALTGSLERWAHRWLRGAFRSHARLTGRTRADGPIAIGLDVIFDSASMFGPKDDEALGAAITRAGSVVLAA